MKERESKMSEKKKSKEICNNEGKRGKTTEIVRRSKKCMYIQYIQYVHIYTHIHVYIYIS
jgi:ribosomal protein L18